MHLSFVLRCFFKKEKKMKNRNIILIGMPGCGKSTVGIVLAKIRGYRFTDSDLLIQESEKRLLCDIIDQDGLESFAETENRINSEINTENTVIATGGSVVYGKDAMKHLKDIGVIVYIKLPYRSVKKRLGNLKKRGVYMRPGQTLRELYDERKPLYKKYADIVISEEGLTISETAALINKECNEYFKKGGRRNK